MAEESISLQEIADLLDQSRKLVAAEANNAALLVAWSAAEAALRLLSRQGAAARLSPSLLISFLYRNGALERQDYDLMLSSMRLRDAVAHGFRQIVLPEDVDRLRRATQRLVGRKNIEKDALSARPQTVVEVVGGEPYEYAPLGEYVVCAIGVCGGRPTFKHTRIEIQGTLERLLHGESFDTIVAGYGGRVSRDALQEALEIKVAPGIVNHLDSRTPIA